MTTDTPRTDVHCIQLWAEDVTGCAEASETVPANFARGLERELAEVTKDNEDIAKFHTEMAGKLRSGEMFLTNAVNHILVEREQLRAQVETLQAAFRGADGLLHDYLVALSEPGQPLLYHGNAFESIRQLRDQLKELQTHKSGLIQDVNNLERGLRDAGEDKAKLSACLDTLRSNFQCTIDQYNSNGPMWTSREGGEEYYSASYVVGQAEETLAIIDAARVEPSLSP